MISVIIPTYNDEALIANTIAHLQQNSYKGLLKEIIVVDGGSTDKTVREAEKAGALVVHSIKKGHSVQMNLGVQYATGKILYFIYPGSLPPKNFTNEIVRATQKGYAFGSFTLNFDYKHWFLKALSWVTKVKIHFARLESQSLFVLRELFMKAGQFREDLQILEDHEIICRLRRYSNFIVLKDKILASTRKYITHGVLRTEATYFLTHLMYWMGYPQTKLLRVYRALLGSRAVKAKTGEALSTSFN
jgi:rSAM/selenodomain-associated transferase 2